MRTIMRTSIRLPLFLLLMAAALSLPAAAQSGRLVGVRVSATLAGAKFWVDGYPHQGAAQFLWPEGSRHTLEIRNPLQYHEDCNRRWRFQGWTTPDGLLLRGSELVIPVTADGSAREFVAAFSLQYRAEIYVNYGAIPFLERACKYDDTAEPLPPPPPIPPDPMGFVTTNADGAFGPPREAGSCMSASGFGWFDDGSVLTVNAFPYPGNAFVGWESFTSVAPGAMGRVVVDRPVVLRAKFEVARRVQLETSPLRGLKVLLDGTLVQTKRHDGDCLPAPVLPPYPEPVSPPPPYTPVGVSGRYEACQAVPLCNGEFDLVVGREHVLSAPPSQTDWLSRVWVFDSWDLGNGTDGEYGQDTVFRVPRDYRGHILTARFVRGVRVAFVTEPQGMKLRVDGREDWPKLNFEWGEGHRHTVSAPLEQRDANGRMWRFASWSKGGEREQEFVVPAGSADLGVWMVARYEMLGQLTLTSDPPSVLMEVDGEECLTPCVLDRPAGTQVRIRPVEKMRFTDDTRMEFSGWEDGAPEERVFTFTGDALTLTARYDGAHRLTLLSDPEEGTRFRLDPAAGEGGFFQSGTRVLVEADPNVGFKFKRWEGALSGTFPSGEVTMNRPATVLARLDRVPALADGAVRNAAAETPDPVVAPGSVIAIVGKHLARDAVASLSSPWRQTLLGVTVEVGNRILALQSVSPDEIVAQLPTDLGEGEHTLKVRSTSYPTLSTTFQVARNGPGLFLQDRSVEEPVGEFYHEDGKPVTMDHPARVGETLMLQGTGLGPCSPQPMYGFAVPAQPPMPLSDALELIVNGESRPTLWVGAQPGRIGRQVVRFVLGPEVEQGGKLPVRVRVNDRESNIALLPVALPDQE